MPGSRQAPDRSNQRARTRAAILDAAVAMLRGGRQPTVAEAAEAAGVHRATAHRYFPTPQSLVAESTLTVGDPDPAEAYVGVPPDDPVALMDAGVRAVSAYMFREEALFRSIVQLTIERWFAQQAASEAQRDPVRETRRFGWIDRALAPVAALLPPASLRRLRFALTLVFGAEALIVTRDVSRLDPAEATEVMRWAAATLIRGALAQGQAAKRVTTRPRHVTMAAPRRTY
jgi:AcrR family transcriptional regulator